MERQEEKVNTLLARVEERVVSIQERLHGLEQKLLNGITDRLTNLEIRLIKIESSQSTFAKYSDLGFKIVATIISGVILWKLFGVPH